MVLVALSSSNVYTHDQLTAFSKMDEYRCLKEIIYLRSCRNITVRCTIAHTMYKVKPAELYHNPMYNSNHEVMNKLITCSLCKVRNSFYE